MKQNRIALWEWLAVGLIILLVALVRIRLLQVPLERDEGEFAYMGRLMLQGVPPYKLAYNMKFPGIYAAYALVMAIFGQTIAGVHLGLLVVNAAAIVLVCLIARRLLDPTAGVIAAASYAVLSLSPSVMGLSAHATHFVIVPALAGILLLLTAIESGKRSTLFLSGILLGLGVLMKQPGVLFVLFALGYLLYSRWRQGPAVRVAGVKEAGVLTVSAITPFVLCCIILAAVGVFERFWFWTFVYAHQYATSLSLPEGFKYLGIHFSKVTGRSLQLWELALVGLVLSWFSVRTCKYAPFLLMFTVFSFLAVCPGLYFRQHYFILMLPAVAILVGAAASSGTELLSRLPVSGVIRAVPFVLVAALILFTVYLDKAVLFEFTPQEVPIAVYAGHPFIESVEIARYIKDRSRNKDKIAVLGSEPQIYFYSQRQSATGYLYMYGLMENQLYAHTMQKELIREIETARPEYIVFVGLNLSWLVTEDSEKLVFEWAQSYMHKYYETVGVLDSVGKGKTQYHWDNDAKNRRPQSQDFILVLKRKTS